MERRENCPLGILATGVCPVCGLDYCPWISDRIVWLPVEPPVQDPEAWDNRNKP